MSPVVEVVVPPGFVDLKGPVEALAQAVMGAERLSGKVVIAFVDEQTIAGLNARYRGLCEATDVLAFRYLDDASVWVESGDDDTPKQPDAEGGALADLGELAVCPAVVCRYAADAGAEPGATLGWTIVHGILHLAGYDHETDEGQMRVRERELLGELEETLNRIRMPGPDFGPTRVASQ